MEELGLDYENKILNIMIGETKQEWFTKINPNGRIPVLGMEALPFWRSTALAICPHGMAPFGWYPKFCLCPIGRLFCVDLHRTVFTRHI